MTSVSLFKCTAITEVSGVMKTNAVKYLLVCVVAVGGIVGLISATQTYAGFPLHLPIPTTESTCSECEIDASGALQPPPSEPLVPREKIIKGTVIDVKEDEVVISSTKRGLVTLLILPETRIWKGRWDNALPIEIGDFFYGYGEPNADGTVFTMEQLEINIVNLRGGITQVITTAEGVDIEMLESRSEQVERVHINAETMISTEDGQYPFRERAIEFKVDDGVQIIGVRLKDGTVLAATCWYMPSDH